MQWSVLFSIFHKFIQTLFVSIVNLWNLHFHTFRTFLDTFYTGTTENSFLSFSSSDIALILTYLSSRYKTMLINWQNVILCAYMVDCKSNNLVYLLSCSRCGMQYKWETCRTFNERCSEHCYTKIQYFAHPELAPPLPRPSKWQGGRTSPQSLQKWSKVSQSLCG